MSAVIACGLQEEHEPHQVKAPPVDGVGGVWCDGSASPEPEWLRDWDEFFKNRDGGAS